MPNKPSWLLRVNEILDGLGGAEMATHPFLTRATVEKLFRLKRRQAIELMHSVESYQIGKTVEARRAAQRVLWYKKLPRQMSHHREEIGSDYAASALTEG